MLNAKNLGLSLGVVSGVAVFLMTLISMATDWGQAAVTLIASVYPGYAATFLGSILGLIYGFIDGFIGGFVIAWIYNKLDN